MECGILEKSPFPAHSHHCLVAEHGQPRVTALHEGIKTRGVLHQLVDAEIMALNRFIGQIETQTAAEVLF